MKGEVMSDGEKFNRSLTYLIADQKHTIRIYSPVLQASQLCSTQLALGEERANLLETDQQ